MGGLDLFDQFLATARLMRIAGEQAEVSIFSCSPSSCRAVDTEISASRHQHQIVNQVFPGIRQIDEIE